MQISDRFHLVKNLCDRATLVFQKLFQGRITIPVTPGTQDIRYDALIGTKSERIRLVKQLYSEGRSKSEVSLLTGLSARMVTQYMNMREIPEEKQSVRGREHEEAVLKLMARADRVKALWDAGLSLTEIAQKTGFNANAVKSYLSADFSPINAHYGKQREGKLEPFRESVLQWKAEGLTYREIHERIRIDGYSGTQDAIRGYISKERRIRRDLREVAGGEPVEFIDKKWLIRLLYKPIEKIKGITPAQLAAIFADYPLANSIINLVGEFKSLLKAKAPDSLLMWMDKAAALGLPEMDAFINGLKQDIEAVMNAISTDYSNGLVEGTVNKIKVIKRIMYGRCRFDLLRSKCLLIDQMS
jgi:predicted transcriptional regulator